MASQDGRLLVAVVALVGATCSVATDELPHPGTCDPFEITGSSPAAEEVDVPVDAVGTFRFNDFPNPDSVGPGNMSLWTGVYYHTGTFLVSIVDRTVSFRPTSPLAPDRQYTLALQPSVRSLRGCQLQPPQPNPDGRPQTSFFVPFRTAAIGSGAMLPTPVSPSATFTDLTALFARRCSGSGCHLQPGANGLPDSPAENECSEIPASHLSLCARDARRQLLGISALQVPRLARVVPYDSARSYLLRKLVGAPPVLGHEAVAVASQPGISTEELRIIESWIHSGAPN